MALAAKHQKNLIPSSAMTSYDSSFNNEHIIDERGTHFKLWSPNAEKAQVLLFNHGSNGIAISTINMTRSDSDYFTASVGQKLYDYFYAFRIKHQGKWLAPTPGIWAKALGTNGKRAAIIDFNKTNPPGWDTDKGPVLKHYTDAIIYEMHIRDISSHISSGIIHKGKFLALTEQNTMTMAGTSTGISHLKELGITHVHILPCFDFSSVDESNTSSQQYNWGYDPQNYNCPEGSYSTNPANPYIRIREMKQMIKSLHDAGIGVVMDVVYNHTSSISDSNFTLTAPAHFYRYNDDGSPSNASGCGNETASERSHVRNFIVNSVKYWASEYHIDGFRFDLMATHDIDTMNLVSAELRKINPNIIIYGEGWTAADSPLPMAQRALKENVTLLSNIAVFSDDLRDAVKGHFANPKDKGFSSGQLGLEEAIKVGIVAATAHPQVDYRQGCKSKKAYSTSPQQIVNYASCHDNLCLTDKLAESLPNTTKEERIRVAKLIQTIIFTSQGIPFLFAGEEIFRSKYGEHNSYRSPDSINAIDWNLKTTNSELFEYYCQLIEFRKKHPALRMPTADEITQNIRFDKIKGKKNVISYSILNHANGDTAKEIKIIFNGGDSIYKASIRKANWIVIAENAQLQANGLRKFTGGKIDIAQHSALILTR